MHRFSRSRGDSQEPERNETPALSTRSLSLIFPARQSYDRATKNANISPNNSKRPNEPLYDHDITTNFPLSLDEEPRIIIAQDDTGVSIDRLLYDSRWSRKSTRAAADKTSGEAKSFPFRPATSATPQCPTSSGFLRPQQSRGHRSTISAVPSPPRPAVSTFVPSTQIRRTPISSSLADGRSDSFLPEENSSEEMDSWLDCMFGKAPMRYKGPVTKFYHVRRQTPGDRQKEPRSRESMLNPRMTSSPLSSVEKTTDTRKDALLMCTTFAVNIHDEDLSEQLQQPTSVHGGRQSCTRKKRFSTPMFGVAIVLPFADSQSHDAFGHRSSQEHGLREVDPHQAILNEWHIYARALNALWLTAVTHIHQRLRMKAEALIHAKTPGSPSVPRLVKLDPSAFEHTPQIIEMSSAVTDRVSRSSQILSAGPQRDWSIWRDELRDYTRVCQDADSKRGYFNLHKINFIQASLTAALSVNLEWLHLFAPPQHQTRLREERQKSQSTFDLAQDRIVVVSADQNKARNLVFIFAKLFPCPQIEAQLPHSRRTSQHSAESSNSRVSAITQGLRAVDHCSGNGVTNGHANGQHYGDAAEEMPRTPTIFEPPTQGSPSTSPIKKLASNSSSTSTRKSSLVNTSGKIDIPGKATAAVPISAPASSRTTPAGSPETRPSSSLNAQGDLMRHLQRSGSTTTSNGSTDTTSLWNSFRSSTWSLKPRRESSLTERSDSFASCGQRERPTSILKTSKSFAARNNGSKLVRMVEECYGGDESNANGGKSSTSLSTESAHVSSTGIPYRTSNLQFDPPDSVYSSIAYTYNQDEGVVDVDFPGCTPSISTARASSKAPRFKVPDKKHQFPTRNAAGLFLGKRRAHGSNKGRAKYDRIAGYLDRFHPDFALQATKPSSKLLDEIKCAMRAELSPMIEPSENLQVFSQETWIEVCSTVIADIEALSVKRMILRRRVRYKLIVPDETPNLPRHLASTHGRRQSVNSPNGSASETDTKIKIIKSDDMDSIQRTYKRNDNGQKVAFRDKRIMKPDQPGNTAVLPEPDSPTTHPPHPRVDSPMDVKDQSELLDHRPSSISNCDDMSAFIDRKSDTSVTAKEQPPAAPTTKRIPIHNKEGKISGWKEIHTNVPAEAGVNDLPTGFMEKRQDKAAAVVECHTLAERFDEEIISKPDSSIINLLQQMLASTDARSRIHSRAGSVHSRAPSRSSSVSGSGLTELQYESKKIIEDALEGLVSAVATEKYTNGQHHHNTSSGGGLFSFARSAPSTPEPSILRQSVSKWMYGES